MRTATAAIGVLALVGAPSAGANVVYQSHSGGRIVAVGEGGALSQTIALGLHPQISPDGRYVAYVALDHRRVRIVPFTGGASVTAMRGSKTTLAPRWSRMAWSPDSRFLASTGVGTRLVVYDRVARTTRERHRFGAYQDGGEVAFSPSGRSIAFTGLDFDSVELGVVPRDRGPSRTLRTLDGGHPVWGAAGLAFEERIGSRYDQQPTQIALADVARHRAEQLTANQMSLRPLRWRDRNVLLATEATADYRVRAVALDVVTRRLTALSSPIGAIAAFSRDGASMLAVRAGEIVRVALTPGGADEVLGTDGKLPSWSD